MLKILCHDILIFIVIALSPAGLGAAQTGEVEAILGRHMEVMGGREAIDAIHQVWMEGAIDIGGLEGTIVILTMAPMCLRQDLDLGLFKMTTGFDGKVGWLIDRNGKVKRAEGVEEAALITDAYISNFRYVLPDEDVRIEYLGEEQGSFILRIEPRGGRAQTLFIDSATYMVVKSEEFWDQELITTTYGDYREVDGVKIPFEVIQTHGQSQSRLIIAKVRLDLQIDPAVFAMPREETRDFRFISEDEVVHIPFKMCSNHIYLEATVNRSRPLSFLLDTGAGASCLDLSLAQELGLDSKGQIEASGVGGADQAGFVQVDSLVLGDLRILGQTLVTMPMAHLRKFTGRPMDGVLGYDFFSRFVVRIDYIDGLLTIWTPESHNQDGGEVLDLVIDNNIPTVEAVVDGQYAGRFSVDTGSNGQVQLHAPLVKRYGLLDKVRGVERMAGGVGGASRIVLARMRSLQLGSFLIEEPIVGLSAAREGVFTSVERVGNIGGGILKKFTVTVDYSRNRMILERNHVFSLRESADMSGLQLMEEGGKIVVHRVYDQTPAQEVGLAEGDILVSIDGAPVANYSLQGVREILQGPPGKRSTIWFRRGKQLLNVTLELRELL